jgi:transglutaminase-like putative cysteine protease
MRVELRHLTRYRFDRPVALSPHEIRLRPAPHCRTPIRSYRLDVSPATHLLHWLQDPQGNHVARYVFADPTASLEVAVTLTADVSPVNPFDFLIDPAVETYPFDYDASLREELAAFLRAQPAGPLLQRRLALLRADSAKGAVPTLQFLTGLNQALVDELDYEVRLEAGVQEPEQTLGLARGSCRDSAWLLVQLLRHLGFAARFVSGYLIQLRRPPEATSGPDADSAAFHAWAEVYLPGAGWLGLDPTSGLLTDRGHIPLAATASPAAAAPVIGSAEPAGVRLEHRIEVSREQG